MQDDNICCTWLHRTLWLDTFCGYGVSQKLGLAAWLSRLVPAFRDRLIEDPRFLFKARLLPVPSTQSAHNRTN